MDLGHILLDRKGSDRDRDFLAMAENLDHLGVRQHFVVADDATARYLQRLAFAAGVDVTASPIVANCLISNVDLVHAHGYRAGRAGLIMTLTRGIPYVLTAIQNGRGEAMSLKGSVMRRARVLLTDDRVPVAELIDVYAAVIRGESELPQDADSR